jgi:hypothetical protein
MNKKLLATAIILILAAVGVTYFASPYYAPPTQNVNGLNAEAGIIKADGTVIPFKIGQTLYSTVQVNGVYLALNDWVYWRFWGVFQSSGNIQNPSLTAVRFKLTQTGVVPVFQAGTEGVSTGVPATSPTETWFQTSLPVGIAVTVPIKYRDNWLGDGAVDNATNPAPYTEVVSGQAVRSARVEKASDFATWTPGTYTWVCSLSLVDVTWTYTVPGQGVITAHITPSPSTISYTFTIVVGADGSLSVSLSGQASQ